MGPTNINKRPGYKRTSSNSITTAGGNVPRATIGECEVLSQLTLSIQNLEFVQDDRNVYNVKCNYTNILVCTLLIKYIVDRF